MELGCDGRGSGLRRSSSDLASPRALLGGILDHLQPITLHISRRRWGLLNQQLGCQNTHSQKLKVHPATFCA